MLIGKLFGFWSILVILVNPYFLEGCEYEEDLLSVSLKDFWDPVELLYVIEMD